MGAKRLYNEMDIMLSLGIILTNTRKADDAKRKVARLMKNIPRSLKPTLGLIMKSKDPLKVIEDALDRWEPAEPQPPVPNTPIRDPKTGRFMKRPRAES